METDETIAVLEIYDTLSPPDSISGERPLRARLRSVKRTSASGTGNAISGETDISVSEESESTQSDTIFYGGDLREITVSAEKRAAGRWQRFKAGITISALIVVVIAISGAMLKLKKTIQK